MTPIDNKHTDQHSGRSTGRSTGRLADPVPKRPAGRPRKGLYQEFNRTALAVTLKKDDSCVGGYLQGKHKAPMSVVRVLARELGVGLEQLCLELEAVQRSYRMGQERAERTRRRGGKKSS